MEDREKQIEEMVSIMASSNNPFVDVPIEIMPKVAEALYNAGYRKLPEDSVVLSREEYEKLKYTWITDSDAYKKGCKETAEQDFNTIIKALEERKDRVKAFYGVAESVGVDIAIRTVKELAKQFGVEIKE